MFERYLTDLVTTHFGHVIADLNHEKVRITAWNGGALVLEDVALRTNALDHLWANASAASLATNGTTPPVEIVHGRVGRLEVRIPWKVIRTQFLLASQPQQQQPIEERATTNAAAMDPSMTISVLLTDVNILITPCKKRRFKQENGSAQEQTDKPEEEKGGSTTATDTTTASSESLQQVVPAGRESSPSQTELDVRREMVVQAAMDAELLRRVALSSQLPSSATTTAAAEEAATKTTTTWKSKLKERAKALFSNLSVTVQNIHMRYEDPGTSLGFQWNVDSPNSNNRDILTENDTSQQPRRYRPSFAIGVTLREFSIQTEVNNNNLARFAGVQHKIAAAKQLAVYWDSNVQIMSQHTEKESSLIDDNKSKMEEESYYRQTFALLNNVGLPSTSVSKIQMGSNDGDDDDKGFQSRHSFVLDSFSPSIRFGLAPDVKKDNNSYNTMDVSLPPCRFSLSKSLLEDLGYLRKSLATWRHAQQGFLLSEETLRHLTHIRPKQTSSANPRGWWKYAYAAVLALLRDGSQRNNKDTVVSASLNGSDSPGFGATSATGPLQPPQRQLKGWLGLARALGLRRRYVQLYRVFLESEGLDERQRTHNALLSLERKLLVKELVAFRIASYHDMENCGEIRLEGRWSHMWELISAKALTPKNGGSVDDDDTLSLLTADAPSELLSVDRRSQMFVEMAMALIREQRNLALQKRVLACEKAAPLKELSIKIQRDKERETNSIAWKTSLKCSELSLQVNDSPHSHGWKISTSSRQRGAPVAVVRLSCAFVQEQELYRGGSWEMTNSIGSLVVEDCTATSLDSRTASDASPNGRNSVFPKLVGLKGGEPSAVIPEQSFCLDGIVHHQNIWVKIQRSKWMASGEPGSSTTTKIRVLPLEVVYATAPVESMNHILNAANLEFADDYNRIASRLSAWRASQQKRLLRALAHVKKEIHVDVVVGAPVLLLPEGRHLDSSLLIFDLGKLTFTNESKIKQVRDVDFDDKWRLELTDIQVQCSTVGQYRGLHYDIHGVEGSAEITVQHLIEPFSLNFTILTKILGDSSDVSDGQTSIRVLANLPRLAVNFTSSTVRLSRRLQNQWEYRRKERQPFSFQASRASMSLEPKQNQHSTWRPPPQQAGGGGYARVFEFRFIAPLFSVKFENDLASNGKHSSFPTSTPLFDLALKGIEGHFLSEISSDCVSISFTAKVRTLAAIDLYQGVGRAYSFLLSSVSPDRVSGGLSADARAFDNHLSGTELVIFDYKSNDRHGEVNLYPDYSRPLDVQSSDGVDKLSIQFNDLFVEWNPETLATISAAFCFPKEMLAAEPKFLLDQAAGLRDHRDSLDQLDQIDDEFFDAEEDAFYDAESVVTSDQDSHLHSETPLLSKVLESEGSTVSDVVTCPVTLGFGSEVQSPSSSDMPSSPHSESVATPVNQRSKPFEIVFMLSKLQVNFNKESRHRRLMTAEMEGTSIRYKTMVNGGSRTLFSIGNLTFSDCESANNKTLYREILGLKTDGRALDSELSSLLEMEMITKPRTRLYLSLHGLDDDPASEAERPVSVDFAVGAIHGFDNFLRARFSPMRFVYLQQFWFEVVDYFFVGVIGNEVWGGKTATAGDMTMLEGKSVSADDVSFTRFDVVIQSPVILFPVSSCSTDFIRLESSNISFRNRFTYEDLRPNSLFFRADGGKKQWFNNCAIEISAMTLRSWSGIALNQCDNRPTACLSLCWPIGPSALVNVPKWKVKCGVDALNLVLDRQDFALLQHIVQYNIGDESHHLEEWYALQSLSQEIRKLYANSILVHFGYDKKDATPSTFDVTVMVPVISFALRDGDRQEIGVLRCSHVCWKYDKLMDRVSKQQVTCDLEIISSSIGRAILSFDSEENVKDEENALGRDLTYQSITDPSGNNTKILTCVDACIHVVYPAWKSLAAFFQSLPQPSYLSPDQAIQVGDRWYRIGEQSPKSNAKISEVRLGWIDDYGPFSSDTRESFANPLAFPVYEFRFSLVRPGIRVGPGDSAIVVSIETLDFLHEGKDYLIRRSIDVKGVEVQTRGAGQEKRSSDFSLIRPWSLAAAMHGCNGKCQCSCECHSFHFNADILHARAAFSDMAVALDAGMRLIHDVKSTNETFQTAGYSVNPSRSHDSKGSFAMAEDVPCQPKRRRFQVQWEGFRLVVADDSGRHFVGDQDLVIFFMRNLDFSREEAEVAGPLDVDETTCRQIPREYSMRLRLLGLDVMDCLQSEMSPFRPLLTINPKPLGFSAVPLRFDISGDPTNDEDTQCREQQNSYSETTGKPFRDQNEVEGSGFNPAVEFWSNVKESKSYGVDCRSIEMQYNPSVVVAMQRFFGRLGKEARKKHDDIFHRSYGGRLPKNEGTSLSDQRPQYMVTQASVDVRHISICLNKEHQRRRLLESCVNGVHVEFEWTSNGSCFHGHVGELEAIDPTGKQVGLVGELIRSSKGVEKFVQFRYKTFSRRSFNVDSPSDAAPAWIMSKIGDGGAIDDFLDVSVSAVELVYFRGRTEELLDYLSNGMPGKGMGATSRAAKGFVSDRIRKRSFFNVHVDAPRLMIPQGQATQSGIAIRLGKCDANS